MRPDRLSVILNVFKENRGYPPYHLGLMVALLLNRYSRSLYSSSQLASACAERVDVMAVSGLNRPDLCTSYLVPLDLFVQTMRLCQATDLVEFGHVAVDGTKRSANGSRHTGELRFDRECVA